MKKLFFLLIPVLVVGCASAEVKTSSRLEQQKKELEKLGFEVSYKK